MKQGEISKYLKIVTLGVAVLFLIFILWFLPSVLNKAMMDRWGSRVFYTACGIIWVTAVPCLMCLYRFWGICVRIGRDQSFCRENAKALKEMSYYMLADSILYTLILAAVCLFSWYRYLEGMIFGIILILFICIALTVLCAALSHLVYKAVTLQEDQDLTI